MTLVNIYVSNIRAPKCIKQILMDIKREINSNTVTVGDFNTPLTSMGRSSTWKINKETVVLNDTRSDEFNGYLLSILPQSTRIYVLFKCTWYIF